AFVRDSLAVLHTEISDTQEQVFMQGILGKKSPGAKMSQAEKDKWNVWQAGFERVQVRLRAFKDTLAKLHMQVKILPDGARHEKTLSDLDSELTNLETVVERLSQTVGESKLERQLELRGEVIHLLRH